MDDMREIMEDFLVEAFELVEQIDHDLIELESNPEDLELLNRIFRVAHTVKGSSSFLNFDILTKLTHHMEDVLNKARRNELKITPDIMDVVLESVDMMKGLLHGIRDSGNDTDVGIEIEDICKRLTAISEGEAPSAAVSEPAPATPEPVVETPKEPEPEPVSDENLSNLSDDEVEAEIERLLKVRKAEDQARRAQKAAAGEAPKPAAPQASAPSNSAPAPKSAPAKPADKKEEKKVPATGGGGSTDEQTIRVEVKRLDHLMNLIGELVLGKNRLLKIYDDVEERYEGEKFLEELNQVVSSLSLVTTDIQLAVMKTRMLPIAKVFNKFPRMIRDLSRELNKQ
ncbi:Hpt domain-containing protein, partial [uncultured Campylobacter sp.]|uniref:Hpt domain-containing protein n=1 Tax=uncultured Campylobacter sp. TaxID=218934 RepID=UPI003211AAC4